VASFFAWLLDATETFFYENADLYPDEVVDFLAEILNRDLDSLIEDGSLELVCSALCSAFKACAAGREDAVRAELARLPQPADLSGCRQASAMEESDVATASVAGPSTSTSTSASASASNTSAAAAQPDEEMQADDGWTMVTKKRH